MHLIKTHALIDELSTMIQSTNKVELWKKYKPLIEACTELAIGTQNHINVHCIFYGQPDFDEIKWVASIFEETIDPAFINREKGFYEFTKNAGNSSIRLDFYHWDTLDASFWDSQKSFVFCFLFAKSNQIEHLMEHVALATAQTGVLFIKSAYEYSKTIRQKISKQVGYCKFERINKTNLEDNASTENLFNLTNQSPDYITLIVLQEIDKIHRQFLESFQEKKLHLKIKKMQLSQKLIYNQKKTRATQRNATRLKDVIGMRITQFESRFSKELEQFYKPIIGSFSKYLESELSKLEELEETKKSKHISFTLLPELVNKLMSTYKHQSELLISKQQQEAIKCIKTSYREISKYLDQYDLKIPNPKIEAIGEQEINFLLQHKLVFDKGFQGTMNSRGLMEYFMGARMYYMYIMMGASMLGFNFRLIPGGKKILVPVAILLVGFGIYQVWSSKQTEKEDQREKHLKDAKEYLRNQFKKISQDIERSLDKIIIDQTRKRSQRIINEAEQLIQTQQQLIQKKNEIEKIKIDRMLKNINNQERNLDMMARSQSSFERNFERLLTEVKRAVIKPVKSSTEQPLRPERPARIARNPSANQATDRLERRRSTRRERSAD